jgi:ArsR family metal-binding transcriptional regulator
VNGLAEATAEEDEAKESLEEIMAKRKLAGNKGWSALSKTLKERKAELFESAVREI